jgi:hypothetical protein
MATPVSASELLELLPLLFKNKTVLSERKTLEVCQIFQVILIIIMQQFIFAHQIHFPHSFQLLISPLPIL